MVHYSSAAISKKMTKERKLGRLKDLKDVVHLAFKNSKTVACVTCTVDTQSTDDMLNINIE